MQLNIIWTGREYQSLENCVVNFENNAIRLHSLIVGAYGKTMYRILYGLVTDEQGCTRLLELDFQGNDKIIRHRLESDGQGNWVHNGSPATQFQGCIDVDIPLTPFTNTLPIRRLQLGQGEYRDIDVLYCDLLGNGLAVVKQRYRCMTSLKYHYENVPNDFEADIVVDDQGIVVDYPQLFYRSSVAPSSYSHDLFK